MMMLLRSAGGGSRGRRARISSLSNNAETKNGRQQENEFLHINKVGANRDLSYIRLLAPVSPERSIGPRQETKFRRRQLN
jgi:hypothetical protein